MILNEWHKEIEKVTIITANQRLAVRLRQEYDKAQKISGRQVWLTPQVLPLNTWLQQNGSELNLSQLLLNDAQELALWERIINYSSQHPLLMHSATAQLAKQAWYLIKHWQVPLSALANQDNEDVQAFYRWATQFAETCVENNWLDGESYLALLAHKLKTDIRLPEKIVLVGFEFTTPLMQNLFNSLSESTQVEFYHPNIESLERYQIELPDQEQELETMARWAKQRLEENPQATIGCIVPNLNALRKQVEITFTQVFTPTSLLPNQTAAKVPYNIAGGINLIEYPLIYSAMEMLAFANNEISINSISYLLRCPFLAGADSEMNARLLLDIKLRELSESKLTLRTILAVARKLSHETSQSCAILIKALENILELITSIPKQASPYEWYYFFADLLTVLGWPGERSLDSKEYQLAERWQELLKEFTHYATIYPEINLEQALVQLNKLCNHTLFQPQTPERPIQILNMMDAIGLEFDALWMMSMEDESWPPSPAPNPFLPIRLQRSLKMPHASPEQELDFSKKLLHYLCKSTRQAIFSFPAHASDKKLNPSQLIKHFPLLNISDLNLPEIIPYAELIQASRLMEAFQDNAAPKVTLDETIRGGTYIFRLQAACPFRAYAEIRLGADNLPSIEAGLDARQRGALIHSVLAHIWNTLGDHHTLCMQTDEQLKKVITESIEKALIPFTQQKPFTLKQNFIEIEHKRLSKILDIWLHLEKQREPFKVISCEERRSISLNGQEINIQIDRIDQLADGTYFIIDYKTSQVSLESWFGERPEEPQLPLYCITHDKPISGLLFAQVRASDITFRGIVADGYKMSGAKTLKELNKTNLPATWSELQTKWRETLEKLADNFYNGIASVDPKNPKQTCQFCQLTPICRVNETITE